MMEYRNRFLKYIYYNIGMSSFYPSIFLNLLQYLVRLSFIWIGSAVYLAGIWWYQQKVASNSPTQFHMFFCSCSVPVLREQEQEQEQEQERTIRVGVRKRERCKNIMFLFFKNKNKNKNKIYLNRFIVE